VYLPIARRILQEEKRGRAEERERRTESIRRRTEDSEAGTQIRVWPAGGQLPYWAEE
jgi:hypothetical protein